LVFQQHLNESTAAAAAAAAVTRDGPSTQLQPPDDHRCPGMLQRTIPLDYTAEHAACHTYGALKSNMMWKPMTLQMA
jgi:hypothetical protein